MKRLILLLSVIIITSSCEKIFFEPTVKTDPESIFEEYWTLLNEKYSSFDYKGVDWQKTYDDFRPLVTESTSSSQLFTLLGSMSKRLQDGHVSLQDLSTGSTYRYEDYYIGFPVNYSFDIVNWNYLNSGFFVGSLRDNEQFWWWWNETETNFLRYATIGEGRIGYVRVPSFDIDLQPWALENMIQSFRQTDGVIIDVRNNTGGDPKVAVQLASYFTDQPVYTGYERFKTGVGANDFSENLELTLQPAGDQTYTKPIIVLTNRASFSATTLFIHQMDALPHVRFMGDTSGGGAGAVRDGTLANGWKYTISVSQLYDTDGVNVDGGREPDIKVDIDPNDRALFLDTIIERAIDEL